MLMTTDKLSQWLSQISIEALEHSCNIILQRDPITLLGLAELTDLKVACQITDLDYSVLLSPRDAGLQLRPLSNASIANTGLSGTLQQWLWLWQQSNLADALAQFDTWGDSTRLIQLLKLLGALDTDIEGWLAGPIGHLPARELSLLTMAKWQSALDLLQWFKASGANFLHSETQVVVSSDEGNHFASGVNELTQNMAPLQQRAAKLTAHLAKRITQD